MTAATKLVLVALLMRASAQPAATISFQCEHAANDDLNGCSGDSSSACIAAAGYLGYTMPPQSDAGWIVEAGPDPFYGDDGVVGLANDFTQRNTTFMAWNLMHMAMLL